VPTRETFIVRFFFPDISFPPVDFFPVGFEFWIRCTLCLCAGREPSCYWRRCFLFLTSLDLPRSTPLDSDFTVRLPLLTSFAPPHSPWLFYYCFESRITSFMRYGCPPFSGLRSAMRVCSPPKEFLASTLFYIPLPTFPHSTVHFCCLPGKPLLSVCSTLPILRCFPPDSFTFDLLTLSLYFRALLCLHINSCSPDPPLGFGVFSTVDFVCNLSYSGFFSFSLNHIPFPTCFMTGHTTPSHYRFLLSPGLDAVIVLT